MMASEAVYDPYFEAMVPIVDRTEKFRSMTEESRTDDETEEEEGREFEELQRYDYPAELRTDERYDLSLCPRPRGGVALGTYYDPPIIGFTNSTAILWHILAPRVLGGTSPNTAYLTSSNQAFKGAEALVRYKLLEQARFKVWDWAYPSNPKTNRWVVNVPFDRWGSNMIPVTVNSMTFPALRVINGSRSIGGGRWRNEVFLYNRDTSQYDRVWEWEYEWNPDDTCKYFFFGPCIEPQGTLYGTTNRVGYFAATLVRDGVATALTPANSRFVNNPGFQFNVVHQNEHHTLVAD